MAENKVVVVDVGGTTVKMARFKAGFKPEMEWEFRRGSFSTPEEWLEAVLATAPGLDRWPWVLGVPGSLENGKQLRETPNLPEAWSGDGIARALAAAEIEFQLENDANLAALGEAQAGAGQPYGALVCLTLGTGVGSGIIIDNRIYRGGTGAAGEVGHLVIEPEGRQCNCGDRGCLENYASATAMKDFYREATGEERTPPEICERFESEPAAREAVEKTAHYLGRGIAQVINLLEPEAIIFSGGLSRDLDLLMPAIKEGRDPHLFARRTIETPMLRAELEEPALAGGVALHRERQEKTTGGCS